MTDRSLLPAAPLVSDNRDAESRALSAVLAIALRRGASVEDAKETLGALGLLGAAESHVAARTTPTHHPTQVEPPTEPLGGGKGRAWPRNRLKRSTRN